MIAVALESIKTIGVIADGLGREFQQYGRPVALQLLGRLKEKKAVDPCVGALNSIYGNAVTLDHVMDSVTSILFPKKAGDKMPPHAQVAALDWTANCVQKDQFPMPASLVRDTTDLSMRCIAKISDPKVRGAAGDVLTALLGRELKELNGEPGPVWTALQKLNESKDSKDRMVFNKIREAAGVGAPSAPAAEAKTASEAPAAAKKPTERAPRPWMRVLKNKKAFAGEFACARFSRRREKNTN